MNENEFAIGMEEEAFRRLLHGVTEGGEGIVLGRIRRHQRLSLREAASYACLSHGYLDHIERGERKARRNALIKLCLTAYSLSVPQANVILLLAGYAPL